MWLDYLVDIIVCLYLPIHIYIHTYIYIYIRCSSAVVSIQSRCTYSTFIDQPPAAWSSPRVVQPKALIGRFTPGVCLSQMAHQKKLAEISAHVWQLVIDVIWSTLINPSNLLGQWFEPITNDVHYGFKKFLNAEIGQSGASIFDYAQTKIWFLFKMLEHQKSRKACYQNMLKVYGSQCHSSLLVSKKDPKRYSSIFFSCAFICTTLKHGVVKYVNIPQPETQTLARRVWWSSLGQAPEVPLAWLEHVLGTWFSIYGTLWWTNILPWKITIFHGKIHYKWPFSIAMLVHQRVYLKHLNIWMKLDMFHLSVFISMEATN